MKFLIISLSLFILTGCSQQNLSSVAINDKVFKVEVVTEETEQQQGLSGRQSLAADQGMLFVFPDKQVRSFWMKDMNFNIDLLWLDNDKIIGWQVDLSAPDRNISEEKLINYTSPQPVDKVLELPAGTIADLDIKVGDRVIIMGN